VTVITYLVGKCEGTHDETISGLIVCRIVLNQGGIMLRWAFLFLVVALVAALFGFGGIASAAAGIAKVLFFITIAIFVIMVMLGVAAGRKVTSIR